MMLWSTLYWSFPFFLIVFLSPVLLKEIKEIEEIINSCLLAPYHPLYSFDRKSPTIQKHHLQCIIMNYFENIPLNEITVDASNSLENLLLNTSSTFREWYYHIPNNLEIMKEPQRDWLLAPSRYTTLDLYKVLNGTAIENVVDIVVYVRNEEISFLFDWLLVWKPQIEPYNLILMIDIPDIIEFEGMVKLPEWLKYHVYTREDVGRSLGEESWIIGEDDLSMLSFGFLASDRDIVVVLSLEVYPPIDEKTGKHRIHVIEEHVANLLTVSHSHYYVVQSSLHTASELPKGHPLMFNTGQLTAISQGIVVSDEENSSKEGSLDEYTISSIPSSTFFSMNMKNLAFNRKLIGPAMYMGTVSVPDFDHEVTLKGMEEIVAGWIAKAVTVKFNFGIKSGFPFVVEKQRNRIEKDISYWKILKKRFPQQRMLDEFLSVIATNLGLINTNVSVLKTTVAVVSLIYASFQEKYQFLSEYIQAIMIWAEHWEGRNAGSYGLYDCQSPYQEVGTELIHCAIKFIPVAGKSSMEPKSKKSTCAVFTMVRNEPLWLPVWIRYYSRFVPAEDIWILDHHSTDGSTDRDKIPEGIQIVKLLGDASFSPHFFLNRNIELFQQRLLRAGYRCTLFAEVDEFIVPDPMQYVDLAIYFSAFLQTPLWNTIVARGQDVCHVSQGNGLVQSDLQLKENLLPQRSIWRASGLFSKPLLTKVPVRYVVGFHWGRSYDMEKYAFDNNLVLMHYHYADKNICFDRETYKYHQAKATGRKEEEHLGIVNVARTYDDVPSALNVLCAFALFSYDERDQIVSMVHPMFATNLSIIPEPFLKMVRI